MKKLLIISISIMIILALSSSVMAKAVKLELAPCEGTEEEGWGNVIINNPAGTVDIILVINIKHAMPDTTYTVCIIADHMEDWMCITDILLTTNEAGNGSLESIQKDEIDGTFMVTGFNLRLVFEDSCHYLTTESGEIEIR